MRSINKSEPATRKLRVTARRCTPDFPQQAQSSSDTVCGNDDEATGRADFDDDFCGGTIERDT